MKRITGKAVFISALIVQSYIFLSFSWPWITEQLPVLMKLPTLLSTIMSSVSTIGFLWLNGIGAVGVVLLSILLQLFLKGKKVEGAGGTVSY
jgi:hypothetical protein